MFLSSISSITSHRKSIIYSRVFLFSIRELVLEFRNNTEIDSKSKESTANFGMTKKKYSFIKGHQLLRFEAILPFNEYTEEHFA